MKKHLCGNCQCLITANNFSKHQRVCTNGTNASWFVRKRNNLKIKPLCNRKVNIQSKDWLSIQKFYDSGKTVKNVCDNFNLNFNHIIQATNLGLFKTRTRHQTRVLRGTNSIPLSQETKQKISKAMKKAVLEGRQRTPKPYGKYCKIFQHTNWLGDTFTLHAGWEKKVADYLDSKQIKWVKCPTPFPYNWQNSVHYYFPDFVINNEVYIEVKGLETERDRAKWSQFPHKLYILDKKNIKNIGDFITNIINQEMVGVVGLEPTG